MTVQQRYLSHRNAYVLASIAVIIVFVLALATVAGSYAFDFPMRFHKLYKRLREDGPIEWLTALLLFAAAVFALIAAFKLSERLRWARPFLILFAIFSALMSLEEISWGQRVFGVETTEFFSKHSDQNEINGHNVLQRYLAVERFPIRKTREIAAIVLLVYGVIMPILNLFAPFAWAFRRLRLVIPPPALILGFLPGAVLCWFDPTGREEEIGEFLFALCFAMLVPLWLLQQRYEPGSESPRFARPVPI